MIQDLNIRDLGLTGLDFAKMGAELSREFPKFHVVTPLSRFHQFNLYRDGLAKAGVIWHPVVLKEGLLEACEIPDWITVMRPEDRKGGDICYEKLNFFAKNHPIIPTDFYSFLPDDSWFEEGYFTRILEHPHTEVIVGSMKRGHRTIDHGHSTFMAGPSEMKVGHVGLEQLVLRGDVYLKEPFNTMSSCADGELAATLQAKGYEITFCRDAFIQFNRWQPFRWSDP